MTLGILVTADKYMEDVAGITEAAVRRGHRVILFFMDKGCLLVKDKKIATLIKMHGVTISLCDFNRKKMEISDSEIPDDITCGSQYDNALMNKESDKVIVL
jgi:predicted peroxiredoxin